MSIHRGAFIRQTAGATPFPKGLDLIAGEIITTQYF